MRRWPLNPRLLKRLAFIASKNLNKMAWWRESMSLDVRRNELILDAHLRDVQKGSIVISGRASASPDSLFDLEQKLVEDLVRGIDAKLTPNAMARRKARVPNLDVKLRTVTVIVREPWKALSAEQQNAFALVVLAHAIKTAATKASQVRVVDFTSQRQVGSYRP